MQLYIGLAIILGIVLTLFLLFKKIFARKKENTSVVQEISSKEVIGKEVSQFDHKTGEEKGSTDSGSDTVREESDGNKEIK